MALGKHQVYLILAGKDPSQRSLQSLAAYLAPMLVIKSQQPFQDPLMLTTLPLQLFRAHALPWQADPILVHMILDGGHSLYIVQR